jgi:hypothetical protein
MSPPPLQPSQRTYQGYPPYAEHPLETARKCLFWGWCLVGGGCLFAMIPFWGILSWLIFLPLEITGFVLAVISIAKGRIAGGICLLLFSILVLPITMIVTPIISSLFGAAAIAPQSPSPNLPAILDSFGSTSRPTTEAEMAAEREEIERQLDSKTLSSR